MSRKAATLRESTGPAARTAQAHLRLVPPSTEVGRRKTKAPTTIPAADQDAPLLDPLEQPVSSHCGLCGNRIENRAVTEKRVSGRNRKEQTWYYHEVCWKQLERMRRPSPADSYVHKSVNPDLRYTTSGCSLDVWSSVTDGFSIYAG